jgi:tetratricopeptide (TPR) repeat protein
MAKCASPGCSKAGINRCSVCLGEPYCSGECQKGDWKSHKLICKTLKKLSPQLQPYQEVARVIKEIRGERSKKIQLDKRVLGHLVSYAEHQFGDRVPGKAYRERGNGERIDNWKVEIEILSPVYVDLAVVYSTDESLSMIDRDNFQISYHEKILNLSRPWSSKLDSSSNSRIDSLKKGQIDFLLVSLSTTERNIGMIFMRRNKFELAESNCQQALSHARLYEGKEEKKTDILCSVLRALYDIRANQLNFVDALPFAEEAYNLAAIAYNHVHPKVQTAAGMLIECLVHNGDLYNAERFAEATLDSLKDPANGLDQLSEEVANGYYDLASVITNQEGDLVKAEMLARESLRIRTRIYGNDHVNVGVSCGLLARILISQDNMVDETMELFERSHTIITKNNGPDGINTAISNFNLGNFYHQLADEQQETQRRVEYLCLSKSKFEEAVRIYTKIFGLDDPQTTRASSQLSIISLKLSEA